jgi:low affinity Fe/Cu permease
VLYALATPLPLKLVVVGMMGFMNTLFRKLAHWTSRITGTPAAFALAGLVIIVWAISGPLYHFSDTWQLVINTGTTILTFLMVFLIQNTQNRDSHAIHLKLDELIKSIEGARNQLIDIEDNTDDAMDRFDKEFDEIRSMQK